MRPSDLWRKRPPKTSPLVEKAEPSDFSDMTTSIAVEPDIQESTSAPVPSSVPSEFMPKPQVDTLDSPNRSPLRLVAMLSAALLLVLAAFGVGINMGKGTTDSVLVAQPTATPGVVTSTQQVWNATQKSVLEVILPGKATGSGFFIASDKIATAAHVVNAEPSIALAISQGKKPTVQLRTWANQVFEGKVLYADARSDVAIIEPEKALRGTPLTFSSELEQPVGVNVYALGAPFGTDLSITQGVVSSLQRSSRFASDSSQSVLIQTDAAVNPGSSGGPLVDSEGLVVGMVTLRPDQVDSRPALGITLAVPSPLLVAAINQLEAGKTVLHLMFGVSLRDATGLDACSPGAYASSLSAGMPAEKAGIKAGDVITSVAGVNVTSASSVALITGSLQSKDPVKVTLCRLEGNKVSNYSYQVTPALRPTS